MKAFFSNKDKPTKPCPYHEGLCGFAKVAGRYCTCRCPSYLGINPNNGDVYCKKENDHDNHHHDTN